MDFQNQILVSVSNAFSGSAHIVFERSTDKEWHNPSGTSSECRGDPLEENGQGIGNLKTRRTLRNN